MTRKSRVIPDEEEARIQRMIASDPDAPEATDEQLAQAKPFVDAFPALAEKMRKNVGGRPRLDNPKIAISIRLDQDVVSAFKAAGPGWQSRMNEALRASVGAPGTGKPLTETPSAAEAYRLAVAAAAELEAATVEGREADRTRLRELLVHLAKRMEGGSEADRKNKEASRRAGRKAARRAAG